MTAAITLDGNSLIRDHVAAIANGAAVTLDGEQLKKVQRTADFLADRPRASRSTVTTGFASNADKLPGASP
jgi:histidine ammonia-lyase